MTTEYLSLGWCVVDYTDLLLDIEQVAFWELRPPIPDVFLFFM